VNRHGEPMDPPSAWCDDCYYSWDGKQIDPANYVADLRDDIVPALERDLPKLKAALEHWDKENFDG